MTWVRFFIDKRVSFLKGKKIFTVFYGEFFVANERMQGGIYDAPPLSIGICVIWVINL